MHLRRHPKDCIDEICVVCGRRPGSVPIAGGSVCRYCVPVRSGFIDPTAEEIAAGHMKDPELIARVDSFIETSSFADLHFDDGNGLFFKGPWPNYSIPVLSYSEISGYRIVIDGEPVAFDSLEGKRALFKACTDDQIRAISRRLDSIVLELDSSRSNVRFAPYQIRSGLEGVCDSKADCLRLAIDVSKKLDSIIEDNILKGVKSQYNNNQSS